MTISPYLTMDVVDEEPPGVDAGGRVGEEEGVVPLVLLTAGSILGEKM